MHDVMTQLPLGYAYHKVLVNLKAEVEDIILLDANAAYEKIVGLSGPSVLGKKITQLQPETGALRWLEPLSDVAMTGVSREVNIEISQRWYKATAFSSEKYCFSTVLQDITSEIRQIEELKKQKGELEKVSSDMEIIFYSTPNALFLVKCENGEFRFVRNNVVHQKLTGFSQPFIQGKTPAEVMGPEIGNAWLAYYRQCASSEKSLVYEEALDFAEEKGDWLVSLTPVKENGAVAYLVGSRTNVTEIKRLRRENEDLLRRLQAMFSEHLATMLIIEPHTGRIIDANPAACGFYGYTKEELLELCIQDINIMPREEVEQLRFRALAEKQEYFLFPHRLKSGEIRLVDVYSCPITYGDDTQLFSIIFDVTDRERYKEALYHEKELLSITLNSIGDGVVTTDNEGRLSALNKAAREITGWSEAEARTQPFADVFRLKNEETGRDADNPIANVLRTGRIVGLGNHTVLLNKQNRPVPIADSAAPILDERGACHGVVMVFRDISKDREQQKQILYLSYHDPLTRLYNRRFIEEEMQRLDSPLNLPLAVIMGDVNGLKVTNDVFGHVAGDRLLQKVARIFEENCRSQDIVARWGGDEFLILLPRTGAETAQQIVRRLRSGFTENSEGPMQISVSLGYCVKAQEEDLQAVLQKAEELMYHQKLLEGASYRNNIINTLLATLYEKSMETEEHAKRLKDYCCAMARELNFTSEEMNELSLLAMLHDIGKVGIHMEILQKAGPLTSEEWTEMKLHPEIGYRISQNTPELSIVSEYILSHHERWDGAGYPRGLKEQDIPLLCRILAVADSYDAMTSDRAYRRAISKEAAIGELTANKGTQFDPAIVDIFIGLLDKQVF